MTQDAQTLEADARSLPVPVRKAALLPGSVQRRVTIVSLLEDPVVARRIFVLQPFAMIAGLVAYAGLPFEPSPWALFGVALCLGATLVLAVRSAMFPSVCLLAMAWLGFSLLPIHGAVFGTSMLSRPAYGTFEARVDEIVSATPEDRRVIVSGITPTARGRAVPIVRARLVVPPNPPLAPGDIISGKMRFAPVPGPILPGAFDGQFHAYFSGVGAYGNVTSEFAFVSAGGELDASRQVEGLRMAIGNRIDAVIGGATAAIGRAMIMGDQSSIDDDTRDVMAASGLAHIYSISGLHLSIVAGGVFLLTRIGLAALPARRRLPIKKIAAAGGIVAATGYLLLAGGLSNVPALRSTLMLGLIFGAILAGRRALTMRNVAIAAIVIILIDPASVFRASFQLSFAAVVALIGTYEMPRGTPVVHAGWLRKGWSAVWTTGLTSLIAGTATLLFSAYHFQQTAPLGVIGNVLVLPVVSLVIMPFAVLSVLAMPFGVEAPFVMVTGWGIERMVDVAVLVAGWSEGLTGNPLLTNAALIIGLFALAWFAFLKSWWRMAGPVVALPLIMLFGLDVRPDLLIADTTQAVAMRAGNGMGLITGKTGSFAVDVWSQHYQEEIVDSVPGVRCDDLGCIAKTDAFSVAVIRNAAAFAEDCGLHDIVVARVRAPTLCGSAQVIDADDLAAGGVHWLKWDETAGRFDIRTAVPNLTRPWRVVPR